MNFLFVIDMEVVNFFLYEFFRYIFLKLENVLKSISKFVPDILSLFFISKTFQILKNAT